MEWFWGWKLIWFCRLPLTCRSLVDSRDKTHPLEHTLSLSHPHPHPHTLTHPPTHPHTPTHTPSHSLSPSCKSKQTSSHSLTDTFEQTHHWSMHLTLITMGRSITVVWLTSCLTGLDLTKQEDKYVANSMNTKQLNPKKINRTSALLRYLPLS